MNEIQSHYNSKEILNILNIKPYFLRFWESEFEQIAPITSESGQKFYTPKDLAIFKKIQTLLTDKQLPIQKAKSIIDRQFEFGAHATNPIDKEAETKASSKKIEVKEQKQKESINVKTPETKPVKLETQVNTEPQIIEKIVEKIQIQAFDFAPVLERLNSLKARIQAIKKGA